MDAAYRLGIALLAAAAGLLAPALAAAQDADAIIPDCRADPAGQSKLSSSAASYAFVVCGSGELLVQARQIKQRADALLTRLPAVWRTSLAAQQQAFPSAVDNCPTDKSKMAACLAPMMKQRQRDLDDMAAGLDANLPDCRSWEVQARPAGFGDAGMSQATGAYIIDYKGGSSCQLRGYPAITIHDSTGTRQYTYATYAGAGMYVSFKGPPLPVTLSVQNPSAWFSLSSSSGCDAPAGKSGYTVDVALPLSVEVLKTFELPFATCPTIMVTPIGALSMMKVAIH